MANPFPESVRKSVWDAVRGYKDERLVVKEIIPLPFPVSALIGNWSVKVGVLIGRAFGSDKWANEV